jgi:glucose-1-phosphate adenylyltransferase
MGADAYQPTEQRQTESEDKKVPLGIGENSVVRRAIIDKNACIGRDVQLINKDRVEEAQREDQGFHIRSGIIVVIKNAVIPDETII